MDTILKPRLQANVKLSPCGRKDIPPTRRHMFRNYPVAKMKVGQSFIAHDKYDYGLTIAIKHRCRSLAKKAGIPMSFAVRYWNDKIRVWRVK